MTQENHNKTESPSNGARKYQGSCHCGKVAFEVETDMEDLIACNCSHCGRKGFILKFVEPEKFTLLKGEGEQTEYLFNTEKIHHQFCKTCGVESFARGTGPDDSEMVAVNVRCLQGLDPNTLKPTLYDGKNSLFRGSVYPYD